MIWYRRYGPQFAWLLLDLTFFMVSAALACWLLQRQPDGAGLAVIAMMTVVRLWFFVQTGMYRAVLRYSGVHSLVLLCAGIALGSVFGTFAGFFAFLEDIGGLGRRFIVIEGLVAMALSGGSRFAIRYASESSLRSRGERVLVLGAGETGEQVVRSLRRSVRFRPVGMVDDDPQRRGAVIHGIRVLGRLDELEAVVKRQNPARLVVAQELPAEQLRALFQRCMDLDLRLTVVRGVGEALDGNDEVQLADIPLEDLLRRPRRNLDREPVARLLAGQVVAVTGAGGSIGSDLCRQVVQAGAASVVLIDSSEAALYQVDRAIRDLCQSVHVIPVLLDLTEAPRLRRCLERHRPAVVFHAAAYKHVPLVESNPYAGVRNNVLGFRNLLAAVDASGVERLVLISTDKAVSPTNVMGASKRVCELLMRVHAGASTCCAVRFGNVLGSSGSVVPLFLDQIQRGGPVTVTSPEVTRYFMLIPEAVELVLQAGALAEGRDIFLLDMGDPIRIDYLARQLIFMTGHVPDRDIAISYTGLRPGEKMTEELLVTGSEAETSVDGLMQARETVPVHDDVSDLVDELLRGADQEDAAAFVSSLRTLVPEWRPDVAWQERLAAIGAQIERDTESIRRPG